MLKCVWSDWLVSCDLFVFSFFLFVVNYDRLQIREAFRTDPTIKYNIDKDVKKILESPEYKACGLWIKNPEGWNEKKLIGDMADQLKI